MAHVVVIGAGFGGLAAAARLQALGHRVTVCEQSAAVGGKLGTYARAGYRFDTGPSLVTLPQVFAELFAATGDPLDATLEVERVDPHCDYRFADGSRLVLPAAPAQAVAAVADAFGPQAGRDWAGLLHRAGRMWDASHDSFVESPGPPGLLPLARRSPVDLPVIAPGRSLRGLGRSLLHDPRLRALLERYATYSGSDPGRAPAALASTAFVEQAYGCWYVRGGLHRLALAMADRVRTVRLETPVTGIETAAGRVTGVRLGREVMACDAVVADCDATRLYTDLLPRPRLVPRGTPSFSGFVLLLGLRGRPTGLAHHTVCFPPLDGRGYAGEFDDVFAGRPAAAPTVYVSAPCDAQLAPAGDTAAFVLVNAPVHGTGPRAYDWTAPSVARAYAERVLGILGARLPATDGLSLRDRVRFCEVRTPADLQEATCSPGGAIYGIANHGTRATFRRAANRSPVPGLFLTGGSAHPGGGLPLVALSARSVAGLVGRA